MKVRTAADTALRLAGKCLWPWVTEDERRRFLADALPLVGALPRSSPSSALVSSESSEQPGPTLSQEEEGQEEVRAVPVCSDTPPTEFGSLNREMPKHVPKRRSNMNFHTNFSI